VALEGQDPGRILTVLAGSPGLEKSLLTAELAARVTRGTIGSGPADVLFLSAEDSIANTIIPRSLPPGPILSSLPRISSLQRQGQRSSWRPAAGVGDGRARIAGGGSRGRRIRDTGCAAARGSAGCKRG
jgi:hypothetical protein